APLPTITTSAPRWALADATRCTSGVGGMGEMIPERTAGWGSGEIEIDGDEEARRVNCCSRRGRAQGSSDAASVEPRASLQTRVGPTLGRFNPLKMPMSRPTSIEGTGAPAERTAGKVKAGRIEAIDAARGTAMLFVFLSHFGLIYFTGTHATLFALSQD